jgi:hypothetical protein
MNMSTGIYRGVRYRQQEVNGALVIEGYDAGMPIIVAVSFEDFGFKVAAYLKRNHERSMR